MKWITTVGEFLAGQKQGLGLRVQFSVWDENDIRAHTLIGGSDSPVLTSTAIVEVRCLHILSMPTHYVDVDTLSLHAPYDTSFYEYTNHPMTTLTHPLYAMNTLSILSYDYDRREASSGRKRLCGRT